MNPLNLVRGMRRRNQIGLALLILVLLLVPSYARWDAQRGLEAPLSYRLEPQTPRAARELIVFAHGYAKGNQPMEGVIRAVQAAHPEADTLSFTYASQTFSNASPFAIAGQMEEQLREVQRERQYQSIHLVGYSMGAVLLRKAYVYGSGSVEDLPFADGLRRTSRAPQDWVKQVDRFVLLAGMNRGWSHEDPPKSLPFWKSRLNDTGMLIGKLTGTGTLVRSLQRGEPFIANLRLQWLDVMNKTRDPNSGLVRPTVVQLLGDQDDVVGKEDSRDVTVAKDFIWVGVSNSNHSSVINLDQPGAGIDRKRKILQALGSEADIEALRRAIPVPSTDEDTDVTTVVFVLHGIRDMGEWTSNFGAPLQKRFQELHQGTNEKLYVHPASYGYFAMGPFLLWADRQRNVRWFMDQVTELKSRFPNLRHLHFIGHSNGTYVLASALEKYNTLNVDKVVFAGSVVRRNYNWGALSGRIQSLRNYVGLDDLVVGVFPKVFELPVFRFLNPDLGSAGFNGFEDGRFKDMETQFVRGGHAAALHPDNIPGIVDFILDGKKVDAQNLIVKDRPARLSYLSQLCWLIWLVLVVVVVGLGWLLHRLSRRLYDRKPNRRLRFAAVGSIVVVSYAAFMLMIINTI